MDRAQFDALIAYIKSLRRILLYILAVLISNLCYAIGKLEHPTGIWLFIYPALFVIVAVSEIGFSMKKRSQPHKEDTKKSARQDETEA